jgi:hypothetical protein
MSYSGREKELTAQKPEKYSVIIRRKNGVRHYPSISRMDYQAPTTIPAAETVGQS